MNMNSKRKIALKSFHFSIYTSTYTQLYEAFFCAQFYPDIVNLPNQAIRNNKGKVFLIR